MPVHIGNIVFIELIHKGNDISLSSRILTEQGRENILTGSSQSIRITGIDALEELTEQSAYHLFFFWLEVTALHFLQGIFSLFDVSSIGMRIQICLIGISSICSLSHIPVEGIYFKQSFLLVQTVRILLEICFQCFFRSAHYRIGPILVVLLQQFKMSHDGIAMCFIGILVGIEITLQHHRVAALHRILISFYLLIAIGTVVEVIHDATRQYCKDKRDDEDRTGVLFLLWFLRSITLATIISVRSNIRTTYRRYWWSRRSRRCCLRSRRYYLRSRRNLRSWRRYWGRRCSRCWSFYSCR